MPTNKRLRNKDKGNSTRDEKIITFVHGIVEINEKHVCGTYFNTYIRTRQNSCDINRHGTEVNKKMAGKIPLPVVQKTRENPEHDADSYGGQCFHEIVTKFLLLT